MGQQYFIRVRGQVQGPFDVERLHALAKRGRFSRAFEVSPDGKAWSRASNHPELFPAPAASRLVAPPNAQVTGTAAAGAIELLSEEPIFLEELPAEPMFGDVPAAADVESLWHYARDNQKFGPVPFSELQSLVAAGQLLEDDLVWTEGMAEWLPVHQHPRLLPTGRREGAAQVHVAAAATPFSAHSALTGGERVAPLAVTSLVLSLVGLNVLYLLPWSLMRQWYLLSAASVMLFLTSVLAVVFGHVALRQIKRSGGALTGGGMALAGLILGYLVVICVTIACIVVVFILLLGGKITPFEGAPAG